MVNLEKIKIDIAYTVVNKYNLSYKDVSIKDIDISFRHGSVDVYWEHLLEPDTGHGSRYDLFNIKDIWKDYKNE